MEKSEKPRSVIVWLSAIHVIFLISMPVLANVTLLPLIRDTWHAGFWFFFGLLGMPIAFAGMLSLNPFPRKLLPAVLRTFLLPVTTGIWWWYQEGTVFSYFAGMLVFEFLAVFLSIFFMCFLPMSLYDPENPHAGSKKTYYAILILQGFIAAGGFSVALIAAIWPWLVEQPIWRNPVTHAVLLMATVEYIVSNFKWQRENSARRHGPNKLPMLDNTVSIEPLLLFAPIPWLISIFLLTD